MLAPGTSIAVGLGATPRAFRVVRVETPAGHADAAGTAGTDPADGNPASGDAAGPSRPAQPEVAAAIATPSTRYVVLPPGRPGTEEEGGGGGRIVGSECGGGGECACYGSLPGELALFLRNPL